MKRNRLGAILVFAIVTTSNLAAAQFSANLFVHTCLTDSEIADGDRGAVEGPAVQMVQALASSDIDRAYANLSTAAKQDLSIAKFSALAKQQLAQIGLSNARVEHSYLMSIVGGPNVDATVPCTLFANGSVSNPEQEIYLLARPLPKQAYVILEVVGTSSTFAIMMRMIAESEAWKVDTLDFSVTGLGGKNSTDLSLLAKDQRSKGHSFNAYMFYFVSKALTNRGPHVKLGLQDKIASEASTYPKPMQIEGDAPWIWTKDGETFTISSVSIVPDAGTLYLSVQQKLNSQIDKAAADRQNRNLIEYIKEEIPEYHDAFSGLIVQLSTPDGSTYRTVDQN